MIDRDSHLVKMQRIRDCGRLSSGSHLDHISFPQGSEIRAKEGAESLQESEAAKECHETVFNVCDTAHINSRKL